MASTNFTKIDRQVFEKSCYTEKQTDGQIPSTSQPPPCFADARNSVDSKNLVVKMVNSLGCLLDWMMLGYVLVQSV